MTKKFWADWQKRIGETTVIKFVFNHSLPFALNFECYCELDKLTFNNNYVTIDYHEDYRKLNNHYVIVPKTITVHRTEIKTVKFIQY